MRTEPTALGLLSEADRKEFWATLALRHARNLGPRSIRRLLGHFGSALQAVEHPDAWPEALVGAHRATDIRDGSWRSLVRPEWEAAKTLSGRILLWTHDDYPATLRELPDAPALLYLRGDPCLLGGPCLAIVGKRQCSREGIKAAAYFAGHLAGAGITIVSGMARGVDQAAHDRALGQPGNTIAVLGTGIDIPYPRDAAPLYETVCTSALAVSEFAPGTPPVAGNFPIRNRIISGLSLGVLVVEAAPRSGSLITARLALDQNRAVFAVPGSIGCPTAQGCQELIRQGAKPVFEARDIIEDLFPQLRQALSTLAPPADIREPLMPPSPAPMPDRPRPPAFPADSPEARLIALLDRAGTAVSIDSLDEALDLSSGDLSALLVRLEVRGLLRKLPGQYYALPE